MKLSLLEVDRFPDTFMPGKIYWSKEFEISAHLCVCGCGDVIYLPIGPLDYSIKMDEAGPTLRPSVGNWNICDAHYFITNGEVEWAAKWTPKMVAAGRAHEDARREAYYDSAPRSNVKRLINRVRNLFHLLLSKWRKG